MGLSNIEWTDFTFNGWIGCTKVSPGCAHCYAETLMDTRYGRVKWGKGNPRVRTSAANWKLPVRWNREAGEKFQSDWNLNGCSKPGCGFPDGKPCIGCGLIIRRPRVFCASLSDWLDDEVPIEWLADLLKLIHDTPNLDWLLLTKRPENFHSRMILVLEYIYNKPSTYPSLWQWCYAWAHRTQHSAPSNIWLGTSVENQAMADKRIPELLKIPAKVRFLSVEPMLEKIDLKLTKPMPIHDDVYGDQHEYYEVNRGIHWAIVGGESGQKKRPFNCDWARSLRDQCKAAGVAYFFKQVDKVQPIPSDLMIREFPKV